MHQCLTSVAVTYLSNGVPTVKVERLVQSGSAFTQAMADWRSLECPDPEQSFCECTECEKVVCDATRGGVSKRKGSFGCDLPLYDEFVGATKPEQYIFLRAVKENLPLRELLQEFLRSGLTVAQWKHMLTLITAHHDSKIAILGFLCNLKTQRPSDNQVMLRPYVSPLLEAIISPFPINSFLYPDIWEDLLALCENFDVFTFHDTEAYSRMRNSTTPSNVIINFFDGLRLDGASGQLNKMYAAVPLSLHLRTLGHELIDFALNFESDVSSNWAAANICKSRHDKSAYDIPCTCLSDNNIPQVEWGRTGYFFPRRGVLRLLRKYEADTGAYKKLSTREEAGCRKFAYKKGRDTTELFIISCCNVGCGKIIGFATLGHKESPKSVFEILFTRFKIAPKLVVYDNGCSLHRYCIRREYDFFKNTRFVIDRFHIKGHSRFHCSPAYNCDNHPDLALINTSRAEQVNSSLRFLRNQLKYMTPAHYLFFLTDFLCRLNTGELLYAKKQTGMFKRRLIVRRG
jgi:hypothetical protein